MAYQNLRFFDNNSDQLNTVWNAELGFYQANAYLPLVSAVVYETLTLFVLEEAVNELGGTQWVTPISESGNNVKIRFEFENDYYSSNDIFLYSAKLEKGDPDLILLDIVMPKMSGFEFQEELKLQKKNTKIPVIILSNLGQEEDLKRGLELGAVDYLVKTDLSMSDIVNKVREILAKKKK